jgi:hypothetical protein
MIKAFASVEREFVEDYKFNADEYCFFDNPESAREDLEPFKEDEDLAYVIEVEIYAKMFNIYDRIHRSKLYSSLPQKTNVGTITINKDSLICFLMGNLNRDSENIEVSDSTDKLFSLPIKNLIQELGYDGYISMFESLSKYTVFNPDKHVDVIKVFI